jgi:regulator of RNase E activity RraA
VAEYATNAPIVVGGVTVKPGDMVIAGGSGAVFIKAERRRRAIAAAQDIAAREAATAVVAGEPVTGGLGRSYEAIPARRK